MISDDLEVRAAVLKVHSVVDVVELVHVVGLQQGEELPDVHVRALPLELDLVAAEQHRVLRQVPLAPRLVEHPGPLPFVPGEVAAVPGALRPAQLVHALHGAMDGPELGGVAAGRLQVIPDDCAGLAQGGHHFLLGFMGEPLQLQLEKCIQQELLHVRLTVQQVLEIRAVAGLVRHVAFNLTPSVQVLVHGKGEGDSIVCVKPLCILYLLYVMPALKGFLAAKSAAQQQVDAAVGQVRDEVSKILKGVLFPQRFQA
mmetsp:Transcript_33902/g.55247  ORF Transcript_33902/g.55247 Transcript_33902/m.55247 type:complete len:256 (+) Transcript_33902:450-1217(+)